MTAESLERAIESCRDLKALLQSVTDEVVSRRYAIDRNQSQSARRLKISRKTLRDSLARTGWLAKP